jgi:hypothetical protein
MIEYTHSIAGQLNRPYKTIWFILQKIRHAMGRRDEMISLGGLIEMDEAKLGPEARRPAKENEEDKKKPRKKALRAPVIKKGSKAQNNR